MKRKRKYIKASLLGIASALCVYYFTIGTWEPKTPEAPSADEAYAQLVAMGISSTDFPQRMLHAATTGDTALLNLLVIVLYNNIPHDEQLNSPLHLSAFNGHTECCDIWPAHHPLLNQTNKTGQSPLHLAARAGHTACVDLLLSKGAEPDKPDLKGYTPMLYAAEQGHADCVKRLLDAGASVYTKNAAGTTIENMANLNPQVLAVLQNKQSGTPNTAAPTTRQGDLLPTYNLYSGEPIAKAIRNKNAAEVSKLIADGLSLDYRENHNLPLLHIAIQEKQPEIVEILLKAGVSPDSTASNKEPALHAAAAAGSTACVKLLLAYNANRHAKFNGRSALISAISSGHKECVELFIQAGFDVNETTPYGSTPLICAAEIGNNEIINLLLSHGAKVNATAMNNSALFTAIQGKHADCVKTLLNACADITYTHRHHRTALHMAAKADSAECIPMLVQANGNIDTRDKVLRTPLHYAAALGHVNSLNALLTCGANPNAHDQYHNTALHFAAENNFPLCITALCKAGASPNEKQNKGNTPLHAATERGHASCITALLECGADPTITNAKGETALDLAVNLSDSLCIEILAQSILKHNGVLTPDTSSLSAAVEADDENGITLHLQAGVRPTAEILHAAAEKGQTNALRKLLANIPGANFLTHNNDTLLHTAARAGHAECVKTLVWMNIPVQATNNAAKTAADLATENNHTACAELLHTAQKLAERGSTPASYNADLISMAERGDHINLTRLINMGADVNYANAQSNTPLHAAAAHKTVTCTKKLLEAGALPDALNADKKSALMIASEKGLGSNVRALLAKGAKVDLMGGLDSAVTLAVKNNRRECLQILLDKGANVNSRDGKNRSLLLLATAANNQDLMAILLERGADVNITVKDEPLLFTAIQVAEPPTLKMLFEQEKLNVNCTTPDGKTAMHVAAQCGNIAAITLLHKAGAKINCRDKEGQTIAHYAARAGQDEVLRQLIAIGFNCNYPDSRNHTPLYYAEQAKHQKCIELLNLYINTQNKDNNSMGAPR